MNSKSYLLLALVLILTRNVFASPVGNTVLVDAVNGNDATGMRGQADLPFLTLAAAKAAASSGDTIIVLPGSYSHSSTLAKNGVNWHFREGTITTNTSTNAATFDDWTNGTNGPAVFTVSGEGVFDGGSRGVMYLRNAGSDMTIKGKRATSTGTTMLSRLGNSTIVFDVIESPADLNNNAALWWWSGSCFVKAQAIRGAGPAVVYSTNRPGELAGSGKFFWVDCPEITNTTTNITSTAYKAVWFQDNEPSARCWVISRQIKGPIAVQTSGPGGIYYVTAQKYFGQINVATSNGSELHVDGQKVSDGGLHDSLLVTSGGGTPGNNWIDIMHWDDAGLGSVPAVLNQFGTTNLRFETLNRSTAGTGISCSAGSVTAFNGSVSTQSGSNDLAQSSTGTLTVLSCKYDTSKTSGTITQGNPLVARAAQFGTGTSNPADGSTYTFFLNTTDSHLYGWNGSAWKQLDN